MNYSWIYYFYLWGYKPWIYIWNSSSPSSSFKPYRLVNRLKSSIYLSSWWFAGIFDRYMFYFAPNHNIGDLMMWEGNMESIVRTNEERHTRLKLVDVLKRQQAMKDLITIKSFELRWCFLYLMIICCEHISLI